MEVLTVQQFNEFRDEVRAELAENAFARALMFAQTNLSGGQVVAVLGISETTLWRLRKNGTLRNVAESGHPRYDITSVRDYFMASKKLSKRQADEQITARLTRV